MSIDARKPHPPLALHVKCQCVGVYHSFNIHINCSALEKRTKNICTQKLPAIRYKLLYHSRGIEGNDRLYVQDIIQCLHGPCCPCAPGGPIAPRGMGPMGGIIGNTRFLFH